MAYFLPSYFQKRLLRYALSRLDFIETDALDLENLGITWGQRSVIELKDVGIQVAKLTALLNIPPILRVTRAQVGLLRLTIPADLYSSGIVVEISSIEVHVKLQTVDGQQNLSYALSRPKAGLSKGNRADRPRIGSVAIHDPGGTRLHGLRSGTVGDTGIPTSANLALSFLDSEPPEERRELLSVVQSHSQYLKDSVVSIAGEGTGAPGGFELPTFVANFFKSVADRLSAEIKDVTIILDVDLPQPDSHTLGTVKLVVKVSEIDLQGVSLVNDDVSSSRSRRSVTVKNIELMLLSEPSFFSPVPRSSASSSPRLSRTHTKPPSVPVKSTSEPLASPPLAQMKVQERRPPPLERSNVSRQSSKSSRSSISTLASQNIIETEQSQFDIHSEQSLKASLIPFRSPTDTVQQSSQGSQNFSHVDNQNAAEMLARRGQLNLQTEYASTYVEDLQDLTESKLFSHEEAESMYMSAVSHDMEQSSAQNTMPGAWHLSDREERGHNLADASIVLAATPPLVMQEHAATEFAFTGQVDSSLPNMPAPKSPQGTHASSTKPPGTSTQTGIESISDDLISKRIFSISYVTVSISSNDNSNISMATDDPEASLRQSTSPIKDEKKKPRMHDSVYSQISSQMFATTPASLHGQHPQTSTQVFDHEEAQARQATAPLVEIGAITLSLDLAIGKLAVRLWQEAKEAFSSLPSKQEMNAANEDPTPFDLSIKEMRINVCEEVIDLPHRVETAAPSPNETVVEAEYLLQILLTGVGLSISSDGVSKLQRVAVRKISVYHNNSSVLSFSNPPNVRLSASSINFPISDDITVISQTNDSSSKTDVQMKFLTLKLYLLQIDDVLTRSGGLSSLLDLGNSIVSTSTIRAESPQMKSHAHRQRSVRFEGAMEPPYVDPVIEGSYSAKMNARIAGVSVVLAGSESALVVRSSAVKLIYRKDLFGLQIDWIEISDPILEEKANGDIKLKVTNTRLEYLNSPKESDLERLLSILTPSNDKQEAEADDDIMVDTLIRQRRKGGVLRVTLASVDGRLDGLNWQTRLGKLGEELSRLSSVSKYLPEDDRPGMLTLALVKKISFKLAPHPQIGTFILSADLAEAAHVNVPSLLAAQVTSLKVFRDEDLILGDVVSSANPKLALSPPMVTVRYIADEMEPTIRVKLSNLLLQYRASMVATFIELATSLRSKVDRSRPLSPTSSVSSSSDVAVYHSREQVRIQLIVRDSAVALNPVNSPATGLFLMTDTSFSYLAAKGLDIKADLQLKKASLFIRDKPQSATAPLKNTDSKMFFDESLQVQETIQGGFVPISFLSGTGVMINTSTTKPGSESKTDIEIMNGLLILETCADSTQTLVTLLNGLSPPSIPSKVEKYRTEIIPIQDMLASFTGNAFFTEPGPMAGLLATPEIEEAVNEDEEKLENSLDQDELEEDDDRDFVGQLWQSQREAEADEMSESYLDSELERSTASVSSSIRPVASTRDISGASPEDVMVHSLLDFREDHFSRKEAVGGTAHRWDSKQNTYGLGSASIIQDSPLKVKVRNFHFIWHLFDGYDWQTTRDSISKAVQNIQVKASGRIPRNSNYTSPTSEVDDESEIGDFLFNSIYIGIPANRDPHELTNAINRDLDDSTSDTGTHATATTATLSPSRRSSARTRPRQLRLQRGRHHKMAFELNGIAADFILFPGGSGEVESSIDVRVQDLEVIDQLPTSTWKKFATYMQDAGEREVNTNMVHIEILNVKPVADLAASEIVLKLTLLPLRLHVDQDAIDFMTRFFEFKDESAKPSSTPSAPPFLQRVEVNPIRIKLDFKPKRVDYAGLRSGRTTEFMNFFVLDRADMVLRRVILYGVSGFDRMGIMLNNIWSPDVRRNQLPGVLAGLAPIRSLVDVGSGVRDLVVVPMREYKKDGRIVRSIQKGAIAFAKTTTKELINLGAKLAIGTQTVLQDTERLLGQPNDQQRWEDQGEDEEKKQISLYADQPLGIVQGLRGAYASLERDLLLAKDAIVAVPGEVMSTGSATGAAQAVLKSTPTIILRPAIGASKAIGQTLLGAGNSLDRNNYRRMQEKYKRH